MSTMSTSDTVMTALWMMNMRRKTMAEKYTYADVIIDPDDPRVEIKKGYYYYGCTPKEVLEKANSNGSLFMISSIDKSDDEPFWIAVVGTRATCIIRNKEPEKKYVPFDFDDPEVRKALMGKTIKANNRPFSRQYVELAISCFELVDEGAEGVSGYWMANGIKEDELFHDWTFLDGSPCGKEMEE